MPTIDEIKTFSTMIEELSKFIDEDILDTIVYHCEQTGLEVDIAATLISPPLKSRMMEQARKKNLLKKEGTLPI